MAIKLVVFDLAGTTVEDSDNVHAALIYGFKQQGLTINREDANSVMGIAKPVAISTLLENKFGQKDAPAELVSKIYADFANNMIDFYRHDPAVKPTKNAEETFKLLGAQGIKICVDTGFSRDITDTILERLQWRQKGLIDFSVTADEVTNGRPYADMINLAMKKFNIANANEVAKVGDTISDLQEGNAAGCRFVIGITTGAFTRSELSSEKHTHLVDDLLQVADIVTSANSASD